MKKNTWLIVANSSLARVFNFEPKRALTEVTVLEHPESRLHNQDLVSDKPGRDFESGGTRRHALEQKTLPKQQQSEIFAKEIADFLEEARNGEEYIALYVSASPSMLGLLRNSFHPATLKVIKGEIDKDMTQMTPHEILSGIPFPY